MRKPMPDNPSRESLAAAFDRLATHYDAEVEANPAMAYMRRVSLETLLDLFAPGERVLEIGCGTGVEAVALAQRGVHVLATDLSAAMVHHTAARAEAAGVGSRVRTRHLAAGELGVLVDELAPGRLDGAYSSFGPLNGEADLAPAATALAHLVRPGGYLVLSVMNRIYLAEALWFLLHGDLRRATRRWSGHTVASVSADLALQAPTWYYGPGALARAFGPSFAVQHRRALTLLLPPPYLAALWRHHPRLCAWAMAWETRLASLWPFCSLGDHVLMVLKRAADASLIPRLAPPPDHPVREA
jgi:SAM-dependent methyltransferase